MPPALAQRIALDFADVLNLPEVQTRYRSLGAEPIGAPPAETTAFVASEAARWREVIAKNNIRIE
jgi:tripartite-type tricarboxylate transporter receptor subunit TctC